MVKILSYIFYHNKERGRNKETLVVDEAEWAGSSAVEAPG